MLFPCDMRRAWGNAPWAAGQTVHNGWRLPACHTPTDYLLRVTTWRGSSASNLRQARYRICIYLHDGPLSCSANQQHQKKATYHVSSTYFFHSLHIMER